MRRLAVIVAGALLLLTGCSATSPPQSASAPAVVTEISESSTAEQIIDYAATITASTPDVAAKVREVAQLLPNALGKTLPFDIHNEVNGDLIALNADTFHSAPADLVRELNRILGEIAAAQ